MTDKDIMDNVASFIGRPLHVGQRNKNWPTRYKTVYKLQIHGPLAASWLMTLYTLLGSRRQEAAREALLLWKRASIRKPNNSFRPAVCHPNRMYYSKGLCEICNKRKQYYKHRKVTNPKIRGFEQSVGKL